MQHYSCDSCSRTIDLRYESCYSLHVQIRCVKSSEPEVGVDAFDQDSVREMRELLESEQDTVEIPALATPVVPRSLTMDYCPQCLKLFLEDPLGHSQFRRRHFSKN